MDSLVRKFFMTLLLTSMALLQACGGADPAATTATTRLAAQAPTEVSCAALASTLVLSDTTIVSSQIEAAGPGSGGLDLRGHDGGVG